MIKTVPMAKEHSHVQLVESDSDFETNLGIWASKGMLFEGMDIIRRKDGFFEPVIYDYADPDYRYLNEKGPYKSYKGAFGAIGASLDRIAKNG